MTDQASERAQKQLAAFRGVDWERYVSDSSSDTSSLSFFSGLLLGLIVGTIVAVLLAPQPGSNTREQVKQTGIELLPTGNSEERAEVEI